MLEKFNIFKQYNDSFAELDNLTYFRKVNDYTIYLQNILIKDTITNGPISNLPFDFANSCIKYAKSDLASSFKTKIDKNIKKHQLGYKYEKTIESLLSFLNTVSPPMVKDTAEDVNCKPKTGDKMNIQQPPSFLLDLYSTEKLEKKNVEG